MMLALSTTLLAVGKKWKPAIFTAIFALINLALIIPYGSTKVAQANQFNLRSLSLNLDFRNSSYGETALLIAQTRPNLLVLAELTQEWENGLKETLTKFPYAARFTYSTLSMPCWIDNLIDRFRVPIKLYFF